MGRPSPQPLRGDVGILCRPFLFTTGMNSTGKLPGRQPCRLPAELYFKHPLEFKTFPQLSLLPSLPSTLPPHTTRGHTVLFLSVPFGPLVWRAAAARKILLQVLFYEQACARNQHRINTR